MRFLFFLLCLSSYVQAEIQADQPDFSVFGQQLKDNLYSSLELRHYTDMRRKQNGDYSFPPQMQSRFSIGTVLWKDRLDLSATFGMTRTPEDSVMKPRRSHLSYELSVLEWKGFWIDQYTSFWLPQKGKDHGTVGDVGVVLGYSVGNRLKWWFISDSYGSLTSREQRVKKESLSLSYQRDYEHVTQKHSDMQTSLLSGMSYSLMNGSEIGIEAVVDRSFSPRYGFAEDRSLYGVEQTSNSRLWIKVPLQSDVVLRARFFQYFDGVYESRKKDLQAIAELSLIATLI